MADRNEFTHSIKVILARRANDECSSPHCKNRTSGPHTNQNDSINMGEAAHIRGAHPGSARYDAEMTPEERGAISNAIWLCRQCAGMVDKDPNRYPVNTLYQWRTDHEEKILKQIQGGASALAERDLMRQLFQNEGSAALQIAMDRPTNWKYMLLLQLLREKLKQSNRLFCDINNDRLYASHCFVKSNDVVYWFQEFIADNQKATNMLTNSVNVQIVDALAMNVCTPQAILNATNYLMDAVYGFIEIDKKITFSIFSEQYRAVFQKLNGWGWAMAKQAEKLPEDLAKILAAPDYSKVYTIQVVFGIPAPYDQFLEEVGNKMKG